MGFYKVIELKFPRKIKNQWNALKNPKRKKQIKKNAKKVIAVLFGFFFTMKGISYWMEEKKPVSALTEQPKIEEKTKISFGKIWMLKETIPYLTDYEETTGNGLEEETQKITQEEPITYANMDRLQTFEDLKKYMYAIDESAFVTEQDLNLKTLMETDVTTDIYGSEPKILIFHTHSQEDFSDSRPGAQDDTIVGVGQTLGEILAEKYGVCVVHDIGEYDLANGKLDRTNSYETMEKAIQKVLKKYPSIEVCIDLHRDGVAEEVRLVSQVNGKTTAQLMLFNGICRLNENGVAKVTEGLENEYIPQNLAFSFHMQATANTLYPGLMRKIYIKPYRYSLNMKPLSLLVEVGANTNTVEEAKNAMEPLAEILVQVLDGKNK